jgi:hypothetical protein
MTHLLQQELKKDEVPGVGVGGDAREEHAVAAAFCGALGVPLRNILSAAAESLDVARGQGAALSVGAGARAMA